MKYILIILGIISSYSCAKPNEIKSKPVLIKIEAVYNGGNSTISNVVTVR